MAVDASTSVGSSPVAGAIRKAAQATGTSFQYLLATAKVESDLNPNLTVRTSTATGLFQFIEQTWLATLKQAGPAFGYGNYASAISRTTSGRYVVEDAGLRAEIMQLRKNPTANALMGGVFTQQNSAVLATRLGRPPSEGELYIAHFFGPSAAAKAISLAQSNPNANAAEIFPAAARANRPIFYDKQGNARSIAGVCSELARRYQVARAESRRPAIAAAAVQPTRPPMPVSTSAAGAQRVVPSKLDAAAAISELVLSPASIPAALAFERDANAPVTSPPASTNASGGMFHSLFQTGERRDAIAPAISELWSPARTKAALQESSQQSSQQSSHAPSSAPSPRLGDKAGGSTLNLFSDPPTPPRGRPDGGS